MKDCGPITHTHIYSHPQTDRFIVSQLFSVARHVGRLNLGSKPTQLYVSLSVTLLSPQANHVSSEIIRHYVAAFVCFNFCVIGYQRAQFLRRALHYASSSSKFIRQSAQHPWGSVPDVESKSLRYSRHYFAFFFKLEQKQIIIQIRVHRITPSEATISRLIYPELTPVIVFRDEELLHWSFRLFLVVKASHAREVYFGSVQVIIQGIYMMGVAWDRSLFRQLVRIQLLRNFWIILVFIMLRDILCRHCSKQ